MVVTTGSEQFPTQIKENSFQFLVAEASCARKNGGALNAAECQCSVGAVRGREAEQDKREVRHVGRRIPTRKARNLPALNSPTEESDFCG